MDHYWLIALGAAALIVHFLFTAWRHWRSRDSDRPRFRWLLEPDFLKVVLVVVAIGFAANAALESRHYQKRFLLANHEYIDEVAAMFNQMESAELEIEAQPGRPVAFCVAQALKLHMLVDFWQREHNRPNIPALAVKSYEKHVTVDETSVVWLKTIRGVNAGRRAVKRFRIEFFGRLPLGFLDTHIEAFVYIDGSQVARYSAVDLAGSAQAIVRDEGDRFDRRRPVQTKSGRMTGKATKFLVDIPFGRAPLKPREEFELVVTHRWHGWTRDNPLTMLAFDPEELGTASLESVQLRAAFASRLLYFGVAGYDSEAGNFIPLPSSEFPTTKFYRQVDRHFETYFVDQPSQTSPFVFIFKQDFAPVSTPVAATAG